MTSLTLVVGAVTSDEMRSMRVIGAGSLPALALPGTLRRRDGAVVESRRASGRGEVPVRGQTGATAQRMVAKGCRLFELIYRASELSAARPGSRARPIGR